MTETAPAHEPADYLGAGHWTPAEWRRELERGLRFTHVMMSVTQDQGNEAVAYAQALADVLSEKGLVRPEELENPLERARQEVAKVVLPRVRLATSQGAVEIELFAREAPNTVANFLDLVQNKAYSAQCIALAEQLSTDL